MYPPEVIDHVLSFLQWDHTTLKVCARAHPSLAKLVEKHLYRHLTVKNYDTSITHAGIYHPLDLLKLFADKPNIGDYVRTLRLFMSGVSCDTEPFESVLSTVTQVQTISLRCIVIVWDYLCESFRTAFTNFLRLPTLTEVELSNIDGFPLSALDHSSSLKKLSLSGKFSYLPPASPLLYPPLDFLELSDCPSTSMEIIASWLESRNLRSLTLKRSSLEHFSRLSAVCANTLTTLQIDVPAMHYYRTPARIPLSLSYLRHLVHLTVQTPFYFGLTGRTRPCLPSIMHFLNTLPSPPIKLAHLIIEINICLDNNLNTIFDTDWSPLVSFPYFDVIPSIQLQVRARFRTSITPIRSTELLNALKQHPHLMKLDGHRSFRMSAVQEYD